MQTVVALYDRFENARHALDALRQQGFPSDRISLIANDKNSEYANYMQDIGRSQDHQDIGDGAAAGAGIGAVLGGLGGLLVGLGALAIPGIGPVLAAGPLISALAGAGLGAAAGGLVGALVDLGIPDEHAHAYAEGVRRGGTLVVLQTDESMTNQATQILNRYDPVDIEQRMTGWRQNNWTGFDETAGEYQGEMTSSAIPVTGSQMNTDMTMDLDTEDEFQDEISSSNIPITGDMDRDMTTLIIDEDIDMQDFRGRESGYRQHFQSQYGGRGISYDTYMPAYRFGYALANDKRYNSWDQVEMEARQEWERSGNQSRWEDVRDAIRHAWESTRRRM